MARLRFWNLQNRIPDGLGICSVFPDRTAEIGGRFQTIWATYLPKSVARFFQPSYGNRC